MTWDYDKTEYQKQAKADPKWHLERLINYGLEGQRLNRELLVQHIKNLRIPDDKRAFLELLLWNKPF